ncbi:hypothetical protein VTK26DRAFT_3580 [Humicola hyalothermophila]
MPASLEKLERQFDRLEKLFAKKKKTSKASQESIAFESRPVTPASLRDATIFPQPTFIRPTSSRMVAREEVALTPGSTRRTRCLPESPSTPRLRTPTSPTASQPLATATNPSQPPEVPPRLSSLASANSKRASSVRPGSSPADPLRELLEFRFPGTPQRDSRNLSPSHRSESGSHVSSRNLLDPVSPKTQTKRKRHLNDTQVEQCGPQKLRAIAEHQWTQKTCPADPGQSQRESHLLGILSDFPALPLSPRLVPPSESEANDLDDGDSLSSATVFERTETSLRKSTSTSFLAEMANCCPNSEPTLQEPSVDDFLALSDDDIADGQSTLRPGKGPQPPIPRLPPNPPSAPMPPRIARTYQPLTPCPFLTTLPGTAAAFEAARIAIKYRFDLVYVVNLWPSSMSHSGRLPNFARFPGIPISTSPARDTPSSPPSSPVSVASCSSEHDSGFEDGQPLPSPRGRRSRRSSGGGITGRLLAAYGLPTITYPFRISAPVHQKVLRTPGWLEYRSERGVADEFARGYSRAFHTGYYYGPARTHAYGHHRAAAAGADKTFLSRKNNNNNNNSSSSSSSSSNNNNNNNSNSNYSPPLSPRRKPTTTRLANRGVVFAAFRLPDRHGRARPSDPAELDALYRDAEALVDMVTDVHGWSQQ